MKLGKRNPKSTQHCGVYLERIDSNADESLRAVGIMCVVHEKRRVSSFIEFCWITPNTEKIFMQISYLFTSFHYFRTRKKPFAEIFGVRSALCGERGESSLCIEALPVVYIRRVYQNLGCWCAMYWNIRLIGDCSFIKWSKDVYRRKKFFDYYYWDVERLHRTCVTRVRLSETWKHHQRSVPPLNAKNQQQFHLNIFEVSCTHPSSVAEDPSAMWIGIRKKKKRFEDFFFPPSAPLRFAMLREINSGWVEKKRQQAEQQQQQPRHDGRGVGVPQCMQGHQSINTREPVSFHHGHLESFSLSVSRSWPLLP